ncbi:hypothetical protein GSI_11226 [Ganoderma sinense ZZ0214-1]|uniref:Uncharacterized protein n=1 Tax=Ganoderma sinense ZZ0214-1 TaxID=1077348 RepID=A0A2G8RYU5_9APHY|nr:hypothetical protein GSI_11226 [Ganoderma sinense ZZ0214-1]
MASDGIVKGLQTFGSLSARQRPQNFGQREYRDQNMSAIGVSACHASLIDDLNRRALSRGAATGPSLAATHV